MIWILFKYLEKKNKKNKIEINKNKKKGIYKDNLENYKQGFDLASLGINKKEKNENNSFLKKQKQMRDLYNLQLELNLTEKKKRIGEKKIFDEEKRAPSCLVDKEKRKNLQYSRVKINISKYMDYPNLLK